MLTDTEPLDLTAAADTGRGVVEVSLNLPAPQSRLRVKLPPGHAGRAEAVFARHSWAAKHYWTESDGVVVYEFDEPLPEGEVLLRIQLSPDRPADEGAPGSSRRA
jgi:uncharacterized lipoprotein